MSLLNNRVVRLETALAVGALTGTKALQIRILVTEREWAAVPVGSLVHMGSNPPKVYRFLGEYNPVASSFLGEEVDIPYDRSWGLQPVDFVILFLG